MRVTDTDAEPAALRRWRAGARGDAGGSTFAT